MHVQSCVPKTRQEVKERRPRRREDFSYSSAECGEVPTWLKNCWLDYAGYCGESEAVQVSSLRRRKSIDWKFELLKHLGIQSSSEPALSCVRHSKWFIPQRMGMSAVPWALHGVCTMSLREGLSARAGISADLSRPGRGHLPLGTSEVPKSGTICQCEEGHLSG